MTPQDRRVSGDINIDPRLRAEVQISRRLSSGEGVREVLADAPRLLVDSLQCSWAVVFEFHPDQGEAKAIFADKSSAGCVTEDELYRGAAALGAGSLAPDASLAGYVAVLQRRACAVEDLDEAPFSAQPGLCEAGARSAVAAKVQLFGQVRYVIAALYPEPISRRYPEVAAAVGLMGEISARFSDALEKAELANLTAFGNARQEFFLHLTGELDTAQRPEEVLRTGADACVARLPGLPGGSAADLCVVDLVSDSNNHSVGTEPGAGSPRAQVQRFYASAASGTPERTRHSVETVPRLSSRAGPGKVIHSGEREIVERVSSNYLRRLAQNDEDLGRLEQIGAHSYMAVPLRAGLRTIGCVGLLSATTGRRYRPDLWRHVGEFIALTISKFYMVKSLELQSQAMPDPSEATDILARYWPGGAPVVGEATFREPRDTGQLTGRQYEVLTLLDDGLSTKDIAGRMHLTEGTVQNHCSGILRSLGANSKVEALAKARRQGVLS